MATPLAYLLGGSGVGLLGLATEAVPAGPNLEGIAAIIAASAGMISAVGALIIALRPKKLSKEDEAALKASERKDQLILEMLERELKKDDESEKP